MENNLNVISTELFFAWIEPKFLQIFICNFRVFFFFFVFEIIFFFSYVEAAAAVAAALSTIV